jgi:hypothetical protein
MTSTPIPARPPDLHYYLRDDGIHIYEFRHATRSAIDQWFELVVVHDKAAFEAQQHCRSIYDVSQILPTPYALAKAFELSNTTPLGLRESIAIVTGNRIAASLIRSLIRKLALPNHARLQDIQLFSSEASALVWLEARHATWGQLEE